jgi:hypothetical protein
VIGGHEPDADPDSRPRIKDLRARSADVRAIARGKADVFRPALTDFYSPDSAPDCLNPDHCCAMDRADLAPTRQ